jgi:hypothetical protein
VEQLTTELAGCQQSVDAQHWVLEMQAPLQTLKPVLQSGGWTQAPFALQVSVPLAVGQSAFVQQELAGIHCDPQVFPGVPAQVPNPLQVAPKIHALVQAVPATA